MSEIRFSRFGWGGQGTNFLLGQYLYRTERGKPEILTPPLAPEIAQVAASLGPVPGGSLAAWSSQASRLFTRDCLGQGWMVLASLASPLLALSGRAPCGMVYGAWGGRLSGKTTAVQAAASVWGDPQAMELADVTGLDRLAFASRFGSLPFVGSSIAARDPGVISGILTDYMAGPLKLGIKMPSWRNVMLLESPASTWAAIEPPGVYPAPPLTSPIWYGIERYLTLKRNMRQKGRRAFNPISHVLVANRGHAGHALMSWLIVPRSRRQAKAMIDDNHALLMERSSRSETGRFGPRLVLLSCMLTAAEIARDLGILEVSKETLLEDCLKPLGDLWGPHYLVPVREPHRKPAPVPGSAATDYSPAPGADSDRPEPASPAPLSPPEAGASAAPHSQGPRGSADDRSESRLPRPAQAQPRAQASGKARSAKVRERGQAGAGAGTARAAVSGPQ